MPLPTPQQQRVRDNYASTKSSTVMITAAHLLRNHLRSFLFCICLTVRLESDNFFTLSQWRGKRQAVSSGSLHGKDDDMVCKFLTKNSSACLHGFRAYRGNLFANTKTKHGKSFRKTFEMEKNVKIMKKEEIACNHMERIMWKMRRIFLVYSPTKPLTKEAREHVKSASDLLITLILPELTQSRHFYCVWFVNCVPSFIAGNISLRGSMGGRLW